MKSCRHKKKTTLVKLILDKSDATYRIQKFIDTQSTLAYIDIPKKTVLIPHISRLQVTNYGTVLRYICSYFFSEVDG
jgi:hypothetical protein